MYQNMCDYKLLYVCVCVFFLRWGNRVPRWGEHVEANLDMTSPMWEEKPKKNDSKNDYCHSNRL